MTRRSRQWVWASRGVFGVMLVALVSYLVAVGLDKADKVASGVGAVLALLALAAPKLLPAPKSDPAVVHAAGVASIAVGGDLGAEVTTEVSWITSKVAAPLPGGLERV